jgi:hypothetical protein
VLQLEPTEEFTAARARNAGRKEIARIAPGVEFLQFLDGDCELILGWTPAALAFLDSHPEVVAVAGVLRERDPGTSVWHRLLDAEWDGPRGDVDAIGGIALLRAESFDEVGGFDPTVAAGEEGELCHRLRQRSGKIVRLDIPMATHDAGPQSFRRWWRRCARYGRAIVDTRDYRGSDGGRPRLRAIYRVLAWGALLPTGALLAALSFLVLGRPGAALGALSLLLIGWTLLFLRVSIRGAGPRSSPTIALFIVLAKVPEALGVLGSVCKLRLGRVGPEKRPDPRLDQEPGGG